MDTDTIQKALKKLKINKNCTLDSDESIVQDFKLNLKTMCWNGTHHR